MELIVGCQDKQALRTIDRFLTRFQIIPLNPEITQQAIELLHEYNLSHGLLIPDALIASTALTIALPLMTRNQKDFRFIPNLVLVPPPWAIGTWFATAYWLKLTAESQNGRAIVPASNSPSLPILTSSAKQSEERSQSPRKTRGKTYDSGCWVQ